MNPYEFSGYQETLVVAFFIGGVTASFGQGYQLQAALYVLVTVFGAFSTEQFFAFTLLYAVVLVFSALGRFSRIS